MATLARAEGETLAALLAAAPALPAWTRLRGPEAGLVMLRGRAGGDGAAFNLGEATVARCAVTMAGRIGHAWRLGRDLRAAELSAALDAALQDETLRPALEAAVIAPLAEAQRAARARTARRAAATEVRFFTLAAMR
ncbi:MAG: phosphonate C-P lyase system protein PhnG [Acetobacteraceae bacterium]|nr:phosphonate C-P lyase system protein PhnG [Acetobacteraceae bacterium]